jgi:RNA-directed DNA polymerase
MHKMSGSVMSKDEMPERASDTVEEIPEAFARNNAGHPKWVFELRRTLYCKAKQNPKYQFYTLYGLVCREEVIEAAWQMVRRNKGAPGVDGVSIEEIQTRAGGEKEFLANIREELLAKTYQPNEVKRVYIPKANGKMRPLGIPTIKDRVVQSAVHIVIEPIFEADFLDCSYGFRPGRRAHDALNELQGNIRAGRTEVYDADLESYFDTIPHDKLLACVQKRITDGSIIKLIRMWLKAMVVERDGDGPPRYHRPKQGTPQGGVISPLLANLYLHYFDVMFHKEYGPGTWANAKLIRYADDLVILAKHVGSRISDFAKEALENRMGLKINREKTTIRNLKRKGNNLEFLGYTYRCEKAKQWDGLYQKMLPSCKALKRIKDRISELTNAERGCAPIHDTIKKINEVLRGWAGYFSIGFCRPAYHHIDQYVFQRVKKHLKRRSQRPYRCPSGTSWYAHIEALGYERLGKRLRPAN